MATYEMLWDCPYCGEKKLLGKTHRHCPTCGAPQDPSLRYFPSDAEKVAVEDHRYVGADRLCPACQNPMSAAAANCTNCGSPLGDAQEVQRRADQRGDAFAGETAADARREMAAAPAPKPVAPPEKKKSKKTLAIVGCLGCGGLLAVLAVIFVVVTYFWTEEVSVEVTSHTWEREVEIEEFKAVHESEWCDSMPSGAYKVTRTSEVKEYKQIPDGQECTTVRVDNGDGTFSEKQECSTKYRDEPVYADKCSYTIDKWAYDHSEKSSGSSLADLPAWPEIKLSKTGSGLGAQREGKRKESYTVHYTDGESRSHSCDFPQQQWQGIEVGAQFKGEAGVIDGNLRCDSLTR